MSGRSLGGHAMIQYSTAVTRVLGEGDMHRQAIYDLSMLERFVEARGVVLTHTVIFCRCSEPEALKNIY